MFMQTLKKIGLTVAILALLIFLADQFNKRMFAPEATFITLTGKTISMTELKGKVVLVNFWATTCTSCVREMPKLIETYNMYKGKNFEMIAVAMDYDPPAQVLNYATQKALPFPVMHDGFEKVARAFRHKGITPTTYVYDKKGFRIFYKVGELNFTDLHNLLDKAVN
jgi:thiol-disulfide isomerase/thioredoxin